MVACVRSGNWQPSRKKVITGAEHAPSRIFLVNVCSLSADTAGAGERLTEGAKGPIIADVDGEVKYAFSNAPADIPFEELCKPATMRWSIGNVSKTATTSRHESI